MIVIASTARAHNNAVRLTFVLRGPIAVNTAILSSAPVCHTSSAQDSKTMQVAVDCRYIRERPSGIGAYVEALAQRLPRNAPSVQFVFWKDSRARGPLSTARNVREVTVGVGPNSPLTILWPALYASLDGYELFHNPHNILPRGVRCPSVVTVHDVLAIDNARLHRRGLNRLKGMYYPQAVWRALTSATRLIVPSVATADRVATWVPDAVRRIHVIPMAPGSGFEAPRDLEATRRLVAERFGIDRTLRARRWRKQREQVSFHGGLRLCAGGRPAVSTRTPATTRQIRTPETAGIGAGHRRSRGVADGRDARGGRVADAGRARAVAAVALRGFRVAGHRSHGVRLSGHCQRHSGAARSQRRRSRARSSR